MSNQAVCFSFAFGFFLLSSGCADPTTRAPYVRVDGGYLVTDKDSGMTTFVPSDGGGPAPSDDLALNKDAFFLNDPPPMYCAIDGGSFTPPPLPGGTLQCPDDKNLEGCPCPTLGVTAACWPGLRANRNLGICMDGQTTCTMAGETQPAWGPCVGAVLPDPTQTVGAGACQCFSQGLWAIANTTPCIAYTQDPTTMKMTFTGAAASWLASNTIPDGGTVQPQCDNRPAGNTTWSPDFVTADCLGHFTLCYAIKAGNVMNPQPTDCQIAKACTTGDVTQKNVPQMFPPLPAWTSNNAACVTQFATTGGYAEMSVQGESITCDQLPEYVFLRNGFCPLTCNMPNPPAMCAMCSSGGSGCFGPNCP
jgi:hypothetical protein